MDALTSGNKMKFIYTPCDGMPQELTKYNIDFEAGKSVDVIDLKIASKMQKIPYLSVCVESEVEEKPKRTRRTAEQIAADKEAEALEDAS